MISKLQELNAETELQRLSVLKRELFAVLSVWNESFEKLADTKVDEVEKEFSIAENQQAIKERAKASKLLQQSMHWPSIRSYF